MARSPEKSCPNLARLFEDAEETLLASFLNDRAFERLSWLENYRPVSGIAGINEIAGSMLRKEKKEKLAPLDRPF